VRDRELVDCEAAAVCETRSRIASARLWSGSASPQRPSMSSRPRTSPVRPNCATSCAVSKGTAPIRRNARPRSPLPVCQRNRETASRRNCCALEILARRAGAISNNSERPPEEFHFRTDRAAHRYSRGYDPCTTSDEYSGGTPSISRAHTSSDWQKALVIEVRETGVWRSLNTHYRVLLKPGAGTSSGLRCNGDPPLHEQTLGSREGILSTST
jgi:hypothetical protein